MPTPSRRTLHVRHHALALVQITRLALAVRVAAAVEAQALPSDNFTRGPIFLLPKSYFCLRVGVLAALSVYFTFFIIDPFHLLVLFSCRLRLSYLSRSDSLALFHLVRRLASSRVWSLPLPLFVFVSTLASGAPGVHESSHFIASVYSRIRCPQPRRPSSRLSALGAAGARPVYYLAVAF